MGRGVRMTQKMLPSDRSPVRSNKHSVIVGDTSTKYDSPNRIGDHIDPVLFDNAKMLESPSVDAGFNTLIR